MWMELKWDKNLNNTQEQILISTGVGKPFVLNPNIPKLPLLIFKIFFILNQFFKTKKYKHAEDLWELIIRI